MKILRKEIFLTVFCFPLVFVAVGALLFSIALRDYRNEQQSVSVTATVTDTRYDTYYDADDTPRHHYDIYVDYTYEGVDYHHVYWRSQGTDRDIGEEITVRVLPHAPDKPLAEFSPIPIIIGAIFAVIGIAMMFLTTPLAIKDAEPAKSDPLPRKNRKRLWFALIPLLPCLIFALIGVYVHPLFHIGTIAFGYITIPVWEFLADSGI